MIEFICKKLMLSNQQLEALLHKYLQKFLIITFITTIAAAFYQYLKHHRWTIGDWLINYQGGFIRRGLLGEIIFNLSNFLHISPGFLTICIQIIFYAVFFYYTYQLLIKKKTLLPYVLLIVSPFIFTFQIYDSGGGFRKEIIFFSLLAYFTYAAETYSQEKFCKIFYGILLIYPVVILSHEMLAVFLPYFFIVFYYKKKISFKSIILPAIGLIPSLYCFYICLLYSGTTIQVDAIYLSLENIGYAISGGAIEWLDKTGEYGVNQVKKYLADEHYLLFYLHVVVLSLIAFIPIRQNLSDILNNYSQRILLITSILGSVLLCVVAIDWGRFIYINLVSLFLISLIYSDDKINNSEELYDKLKNYLNNKVNLTGCVLLVVFYTQLWHIELCCEPIPYSQVNLFKFVEPYLKLLGYAFK